MIQMPSGAMARAAEGAAGLMAASLLTWNGERNMWSMMQVECWAGCVVDVCEEAALRCYLAFPLDDMLFQATLVHVCTHSSMGTCDRVRMAWNMKHALTEHASACSAM